MADDIKNMEDLEKTVIKKEPGSKGEGEVGEDVPYLIVVQGPRQGLRFPLVSGDNVLGRVIGSDILLDDQSVSRQHSIITQNRGVWTIEDRGSKNGTFINNQRISEKVTIGHGDVVQVGIYSLRLITKTTGGDEMKKLPPEWEGKTMMVEAPKEDTTATIAREDRGTESVALSDEERPELDVPEAEEEPEKKKKRPIWWNILLILIFFLVAGGAGAYVYFNYIYSPPKPKKPMKPPVVAAEQSSKTASEGDVAQEGDVVPGAESGFVPSVPIMTRELAKEVPVFLDFVSSPLPATVTLGDKTYGEAPIKVQEKLEVGREYTAEAVFVLKEIGERYKEQSRFTVSRDEPLIPVLFKGPIGAIKVMELPRDTTLCLEAYFVYDPFNAKTAKLSDVTFGKPIYIPYGKYMVELRKPKELAGSGTFTEDIVYKREILLTEDNPLFMLKVVDKDLTEFPVEVLSVPQNADVFIDGAKVGVTPYKGIFPLGEHTLSLRKDGYFEHKQELKIDMNVSFKTEIVMKTTVSGEFINAGKLMMQNGQYKEAIDRLTEVFKQTSAPGEVAQARYLIGSSFVHLGDLATAEGYFKQSVEDEAMKHPSLLGLVSVYNGLGRKMEAIPPLVEVILNAKDDEIKREANKLFQQVSPLRSIMYILTDPEGATVYMNDKLIPEKTPMIMPDLTLGNYNVRIEKDGYLPQTLSINFSVNEFNPVVVKLRPKLE